MDAKTIVGVCAFAVIVPITIRGLVFFISEWRGTLEEHEPTSKSDIAAMKWRALIALGPDIEAAGLKVSDIVVDDGGGPDTVVFTKRD